MLRRRGDGIGPMVAAEPMKETIAVKGSTSLPLMTWLLRKGFEAEVTVRRIVCTSLLGETGGRPQFPKSAWTCVAAGESVHDDA